MARNDRQAGALTPRKRLFAGYVASGRGIEDAGAAIGISARTAWRWADAAAVKGEVTRLQDAAMASVASALRTLAPHALTWLAAVGKDTTAPPAARVSAARAILGGGLLEYREVLDLEQRISALEAALAREVKP